MAEATASRLGSSAYALTSPSPPGDRPRLFFTLNAALLFACTSMYLGTGWSLVLFSFPSAPQLTPDNYYLQFVPPVEAATRFFTYMTMVMIASAIVMAWNEWRTGYRWIPIVVLAAIVAATVLTVKVIFPYNQEMASHISDPARLGVVLDGWMSLNKVRVALWTLQWGVMSVYLILKVQRAPRLLRA